MDYEDHNKFANLALWLTAEQCAYLKTVVSYRYVYSAECAKQLADLDLIIMHGRLLIPTSAGREVAKRCRV